MLIRIAVIIPLAFLVAYGLYSWAEGSYDRFKHASEESRTVRDLDPHHSEDLDASALRSDMTLYAVVGAALAGFAGLACHPSAGVTGRVIGLITGLLLGGAAGVGSGYIGHAIDRAILVPDDPMIYWFGRWAAMLFPIGLAAGIGSAVSGKSIGKDLPEGLVGAFLGVAIATIVYCLSSGAITEIENHEWIYPAFKGNRLLILGLASVSISTLIAFRLSASVKNQTSADSAGNSGNDASAEHHAPSESTASE